jgi:hypothetical protein
MIFRCFVCEDFFSVLEVYWVLHCKLSEKSTVPKYA